MTIEEFGQSIKAKYPQYQDVPDAELGQKMLTKYPQYQDMVKGGTSTTTPAQSPQPTPTPQPAQNSGGYNNFMNGIGDSIGNAEAFMAKDVLGAGPQQQGGFLGDIFQSTVGSKGLAGVAQLPGKTIAALSEYAPFVGKHQGEDLYKQASDASGQAYEWLIKAKNTQDPTLKAKYINIAKQLQASALDLNSHANDIQGYTNTTGGQALGTAVNAATTAAAFGMPGATSLAGKVGQGALLGYGTDVGGKLSNKESNPLMPGMGTVVGAGLPLLNALVGAIAKRTAGALTGTGKDVIQRAIDNPDAVGDAIKEYATTPEAKQSLVDRARAAINDYLHNRSTSFGDTVNSMTSKTQLTKEPVVGSFTKGIQKFGGEINGKGALSFTDTTLTEADQSALQTAWKKISTWKDTSPKGLENLRQAVGNLMDDFKMAGNSRANVVLGEVKKDLVKYVGSNTEGYTQALTKYGKESDTARYVLKELNLGGNAKPSTQINQVMRLFKKDPQLQQNLVKVMGKKGANDFMNEISGAILSEWIPAGKMGNWVRLLTEGGGIGLGILSGHPGVAVTAAGTVAGSSPRVVGNAATLVGKLTKDGVTTGARRAATVGAGKIAN